MNRLIVPMKRVVFLPNETLLNDQMFESEEKTLHTLHQWLPLSAGKIAYYDHKPTMIGLTPEIEGRGYIPVADWKKYDLANPYDISVTRHENGPGYMMSVFHQLHCLVSIIDSSSIRYG
jgi:hypothetical protein